MDKKDILWTFGQLVQENRHNKRWTQEQLAFECKLDRTYISSVERGKRNISILNIYKIANALDIPAKNLLPTWEV